MQKENLFFFAFPSESTSHFKKSSTASKDGAAAPLPCRGGEGVGSVTASRQVTFCKENVSIFFAHEKRETEAGVKTF